MSRILDLGGSGQLVQRHHPKTDASSILPHVFDWRTSVHKSVATAGRMGCGHATSVDEPRAAEHLKAAGQTALVPAVETPRIPVKVECTAANVYEIDPMQDKRWDALVQNHPQSSVFHTTKWLRALRDVYNYEPAVVTTSSPREPLTNGVVFCRVKSWLTGRRLVSLPFSDHCEALVDSPIDHEALLTHLTQQVKQGEWKYIEIRPITREPSCHTELSRFDTFYLHSLDLRLSEAQLFRNFHKDCIQRKIHRAEREKLEYEEGRSDALLQKFYRLVVMTRRRQNLPPQPLNWFRGLIAAFGRDLKIRVASKGGLPVASILTLSHRKSMVYKYGCSNAAFNNLGGTALLFWETIQEAKARGFEEIELGRSDVDNPGLVAFKEHWGASGRLIGYWSYPRGPEGLPSVWKKRLARHLVSTVPDLALEMIGKLLYRHVG